MTIPRRSVTTGYAFSSAPGATPTWPATSSIVVIPGVDTSAGAASPAGSSIGCASAEATSTFAA